jgi:hypothetical protein
MVTFVLEKKVVLVVVVVVVEALLNALVGSKHMVNLVDLYHHAVYSGLYLISFRHCLLRVLHGLMFMKERV